MAKVKGTPEYKAWYEKYKHGIWERAIKARAIAVARNKKYVWDIKIISKCIDCKKKYHPCVMDFDHISNNKTKGVGRLVQTGSKLELLKKEIEKCELVCVNCHRFRTWNRSHLTNQIINDSI